MGEHRLRAEPTMSREERDRLIVSLQRSGWTATKIAGHLGMTRPGVSAALKRLRAEPEDFWDGWEGDRAD